MPVPGLSLLGLKRIRGFVSILRYINPTIIIINIILNKGRLTGNRPGGTRHETGRKKSLITR